MKLKHISLSFLCITLLISSCIEEDSYGEGLEIYEKGENRRNVKEKEEITDDIPQDTSAVDVKDTTAVIIDNFDFTTLSGIYAGNLLDPDPEEPPSPLDVTATANKDITFDLALYDAVVSGLELGDLIFTGIPATYDKNTDSYNFALKGKDVELLGGAIQAVVDVDGNVAKTGELKFSVAIQEPELTLNYEGTKK